METKLSLSVVTIFLIAVSGCKPGDLTEKTIQVDVSTGALTAKLKKEKDRRKIPRFVHKKINYEFNEKRYTAWTLRKNQIKKTEFMWSIRYFKNRPGFGENKQERSKEWMNNLIDSTLANRYPNHIQTGIICRNTNLRLLPTNKPHFSHFKHDGQGFPFDNLQNSAIHVNTPVMVTHLNKTKSWAYVKSGFASGWVQVQDLAYTGPRFKKAYKKVNRYIATIKEDTPIFTLSNNFLFKANIGSQFKKVGETKSHYLIIVPMPNAKRYAYVKKAKIPKTHAVEKPYPLTIQNISKLCDELLDQPYGWGGLYENRDCSALIQDVFSPFSIWLPRHSSAQAKKGGVYINLSTLEPEKREEMIKKNATPYLTLLWLPGHIMLYVGQHQDRAIVFHNIWGLRTKDALKRKIIGRTVLTTLEPGKHIKDLDHKMSLLNRVEGMTLLVPRYPN